MKGRDKERKRERNIEKEHEERERMKKREEDWERMNMQAKYDFWGHMCISAYVHVFKSVNV